MKPKYYSIKFYAGHLEEMEIPYEEYKVFGVNHKEAIKAASKIAVEQGVLLHEMLKQDLDGFVVSNHMGKVIWEVIPKPKIK